MQLVFSGIVRFQCRVAPQVWLLFVMSVVSQSPVPCAGSSQEPAAWAWAVRKPLEGIPRTVRHRPTLPSGKVSSPLVPSHLSPAPPPAPVFTGAPVMMSHHFSSVPPLQNEVTPAEEGHTVMRTGFSRTTAP